MVPKASILGIELYVNCLRCRRDGRSEVKQKLDDQNANVKHLLLSSRSSFPLIQYAK